MHWSHMTAGNEQHLYFTTAFLYRVETGWSGLAAAGWEALVMKEVEQGGAIRSAENDTKVPTVLQSVALIHFSVIDCI